jgi:hypothetical protein
MWEMSWPILWLGKWKWVFFPHHSFQIGSGAQAFFWSLDIGDFSMWVKEPGHEADHTPHIMPMLRMIGALPPVPHVSWLRARGHLIQKCLEQKLYYNEIWAKINCCVMYCVIVRVSFQKNCDVRLDAKCVTPAYYIEHDLVKFENLLNFFPNP